MQNGDAWIIPVNPQESGKRWKFLDIDEQPQLLDFNVGNNTQYRIVSFRKADDFFIGVQGRGCFLFNAHSIKFPDYVGEKLTISLADANNITDWFNIQLNIDAPEFGEYAPEFLEKN